MCMGYWWEGQCLKFILKVSSALLSRVNDMMMTSDWSDYFLLITLYLKVSIESIFMKLFIVFILYDCWILWILLHSRHMHRKTVIDFQYFTSSIKNMKNIYSSSTHQICYILSRYDHNTLKIAPTQNPL